VGGAYGKVWAHNEVVLQALRPFFPQEVLNSRVYSRLHPAPINQGFDGCLEHLRLASAALGSPTIVWDGDSFVPISARGRVTLTPKRQLLSLSLACLQCLVPALRAWTVASGGRAWERSAGRPQAMAAGDGRRRWPPAMAMASWVPIPAQQAARRWVA